MLSSSSLTFPLFPLLPLGLYAHRVPLCGRPGLQGGRGLPGRGRGKGDGPGVPVGDAERRERERGVRAFIRMRCGVVEREGERGGERG